jgi:hypothetical protein
MSSYPPESWQKPAFILVFIEARDWRRPRKMSGALSRSRTREQGGWCVRGTLLRSPAALPSLLGGDSCLTRVIAEENKRWTLLAVVFAE